MSNSGKNCQKVAKVDFSDKKFIRVAKSLKEQPKVAKKILKSAKRGLNLPTVAKKQICQNLSKLAKTWQKLVKVAKKNCKKLLKDTKSSQSMPKLAEN